LVATGLAKKGRLGRFPEIRNWYSLSFQPIFVRGHLEQTDPLNELIRHLARFAGIKGVAIVLLALAASLSTGVGLVLLVPLLALLDIGGMGGSDNLLTIKLQQLFSLLGLELTLETILGLFLLLLLFQTALGYLRDRESLKLRLAFVEQLRLDLYLAITRMRWASFTTTRPSDFTHALVTDIGRVNQAAHTIQQLTTSGILASAYLAAALYLSPLFSLLVIISALVMGLVLRPLNRRVSRQGHHFGIKHRDLLHRIQEDLASLKLSRCFANQGQHEGRFQQDIDEIREQQLAHQRTTSLTRGILHIGGGFALVTCVYLGVARFQLPAPQLLVLIYTFARLLPQINGLQQSWQQLGHLLPAYQSIIEQQHKFEGEAVANSGSPPPAHAPEAEIRFTDVSFSYPSHPERAVLRNIDLTIPAHQTTAIVGPSGGGKSTLIDLLLGLLQPQQGTIQVDGRLLQGWHQHIAYVPQENYLFHTSVRENLLWAAPDAGEPALWQALDKAAAADFIKALPDGLDTLVGERGIQLSGGERQRLALARALLRQPSLLVLDEATSALDHDSEQAIRRAIEQLHGNLTIVLVAHRPSTVRGADRAIVIRNGEVAEAGPLASLLHDEQSYLRFIGKR
jgi:ATP-binding cassette subfamily C protein